MSFSVTLSTVLPGGLNDLSMRENSWLSASRGFKFSSRWDFDHISRLMWEALGSFQGWSDFVTHQCMTFTILCTALAQQWVQGGKGNGLEVGKLNINFCYTSS